MRLHKLCSSYVVQLHSYLHGSCCVSVLLLLLLVRQPLQNVRKPGHSPVVYVLQAAQSCADLSSMQAACAAAAAIQSPTGNRGS